LMAPFGIYTPLGFLLKLWLERTDDITSEYWAERKDGPTRNKRKRTPWPLVRERTVPTERLPLLGEKYRVLCGKHNGSLQPYSRNSRAEELLLLPSSSSVVLTKLSAPIPNPLFHRKFGSAGTSGSVATNSNH
jgi:hypothetical protein